MAHFVPFQGLRYDADPARLQNLVCPPYDIIGASERAALIANDPDNIVSVELPEGGDDRYIKAAEKLAQLIASGLLRSDRQDAFYIYRMQYETGGEEKSVEGIIGRLRLEPLDGGTVLPHENTLSKAKDDRLSLMKVTAANISSVYALFGDGEGAAAKIAESALRTPALAAAELDGVRHSVYSVSGGDTAKITELFSERTLFIADGHHRYETGLNYKAYRESLGETVDDGHPANYIMATCVAMEHPGLSVFPTHRMIRRQPGFCSERLLRSVSAEFDISKQKSLADGARRLRECYDGGVTAFLYYDGEYRLLSLKAGTDLAALIPGRSASYRALDVSVLHSVILERYLGIDPKDMAGGKSLSYTRDADEAADAVDRGEAGCAFIINPTRISEIAAVARDGERMPQKSTYFYPKLVTGLVLNKM